MAVVKSLIPECCFLPDCQQLFRIQAPEESAWPRRRMAGYRLKHNRRA